MTHFARLTLWGVTLAGLFSGAGNLRAIADEPPTRENFENPGPNLPEEPVAKSFSLTRAARFLDNAALSWQTQRGCFTCHTNYAYLYARPAIAADVEAHRDIRREAESLVMQRWEEKGPRWDAEVVATAAALAFNDSATTGKLSPAARSAFDLMWTRQRRDGGFQWIKCGWPPMELDDHYGVTLAAIAVGVAPDNYASTPEAREGLEGIRQWLKSHEAPTLHHKVMMLWASTMIEGIFTDAERKSVVETLWGLQGTDGGWNLASLGPWKRGDGREHDLKTSDGYGTGFVLYVLRKAGIPSADPRIEKGIAWLKANQRESGRWFTRSAFKDSKHYITHAGTAFAIMALKECGQIETAGP
ncbi:MAG: terpene cyclase/mutase family protein [Planctomycetaceae bacterium]|nr:terpene cyclase/mutase family protein [Planctomycetaceae bacterium]